MKLPEPFVRAAVLATLLVSATVSAALPIDVAPPELLDAAEAFQVSARFLNTNTVEFSYQIADGYYMYRERFRFAADDGKPFAAKARIPAGKFKQDLTFGRVETYRKSVRVLLPLANAELGGISAATGTPVFLLATSQGCADAGVCYPPQHHQFKLERGSMALVRPLSASNSGFTAVGPQSSSSLPTPGSGKISDLIKRAP